MVIAGAWLGLCALTLVRAARQLQSGVSAATTVRGEVTAKDVADDRAGPDLRAALTRFTHAHRLLADPWIAPLEIVPYFGRQLRSAQDLSAAAVSVAAAGSQTLQQAHLLLTAPHATPAQRASLVRQLATTVATLSRRLSHVDLGPSQALFPAIASKRATFGNDLAKLRTTVDRGTGATAALADLFTGPRTYLVLAANNAEMRAGSGMFLEAGTVTVSEGTLSFGSFTSTGDLYNPSPTVPLTGNLASLWGGYHPNQEWRNLALSPQFPANAALAAQMWQTQMGQRVDGVLVIDVAGLQAFLSATGPISAGSLTVDAGDVESTLLKQQYVGLSADQSVNDARREELGALAGTVLGAVQQPGVPLAKLGGALASAVNGRHLLAWSTDPVIERDWVAADAGGEVHTNAVLLALLNQGANKLDPYQTIRSTMSLSSAGRNTRVTIRANIANDSPAGLSSYAAAGANPALAPGSYVGLAALDVPKAAGSLRVDRPTVAISGRDYTSDVVGVNVTLAPGQSTTVAWTFLLAGRHGELGVDPSARLPATMWYARGQTFTDATPRLVRW